MPTVDEVVRRYIQQRDVVNAIKKRHKEELAEAGKVLTKLEGWLHRELNRLEAKNIATNSGTVFKKTRKQVTVQDWEAFFEFVQEHELYHFLERRANPSAVEEFVEDQGELPPGLSLNQDETVNVRR